MSVFEIIGLCSKAFVLAPVAIGVAHYATLKKPYKVFLLFLMLYVVFDVITSYTSLNGIHNLPLYHLMTVVEFVFYSYMYHVIAKNTSYKKWILFIIFLFIIFAVLNTIYLENIYTDYNSNTRVVASLILVSYAISYFYRMLKELTVESVGENDVFWFNTAVLLYFAGTFFLSLFLKVFFDEAKKTEGFQEFLYQIYYLQYFLYIILNILLAKAIWVSQPSK